MIGVTANEPRVGRPHLPVPVAEPADGVRPVPARHPAAGILASQQSAAAVQRRVQPVETAAGQRRSRALAGQQSAVPAPPSGSPYRRSPEHQLGSLIDAYA